MSRSRSRTQHVSPTHKRSSWSLMGKDSVTSLSARYAAHHHAPRLMWHYCAMTIYTEAPHCEGCRVNRHVATLF